MRLKMRVSLLWADPRLTYLNLQQEEPANVLTTTEMEQAKIYL